MVLWVHRTVTLIWRIHGRWDDRLYTHLLTRWWLIIIILIDITCGSLEYLWSSIFANLFRKPLLFVSFVQFSSRIDVLNDDNDNDNNNNNNNNNNNSAGAFLADLGRKISGVSGEKRGGLFLFQWLSIVVQRYNAILLHESFYEGDEPNK